MASAPRTRRWSMEMPPDLSELMDTLIKYAHSFIREFDNKEPDMRRIVRELQKISDEVRKKLERLNTHQNRAATITTGLILAPFTGGLSLALTALTALTAGAGVAAATTAIMKSSKMKGSISKVEKLGKEFMKIVEPLKNDLEQIQTTCEKLEQKSSEVRAKYSLKEMEEFEGILRRVSKLGKTSEGVLGVVVTVLGWIGDLLMLVVNVIAATVSVEAQEELRASIIESAERCQKVVHEFETMKEELTEFI